MIPHNFLALPQEQSSIDTASVALIPVPYDSTTSFRSGSRDGPEAMIRASYGLEDYDFELDLDVSEIGIHTTGALEPQMAGPGQMAQRIKAYRDSGCIVTLDSLVEGLQGGTGESFDWSIAADLAGKGNAFILAGGLSPVNITEAVATVGPWGVDVSSGVETNGDKDHEKIRQFIINAKKHPAMNSKNPKSSL